MHKRLVGIGGIISIVSGTVTFLSTYFQKGNLEDKLDTIAENQKKLLEEEFKKAEKAAAEKAAAEKQKKPFKERMKEEFEKKQAEEKAAAEKAAAEKAAAEKAAAEKAAAEKAAAAKAAAAKAAAEKAAAEKAAAEKAAAEKAAAEKAAAAKAAAEKAAAAKAAADKAAKKAAAVKAAADKAAAEKAAAEKAAAKKAAAAKAAAEKAKADKAAAEKAEAEKAAAEKAAAEKAAADKAAEKAAADKAAADKAAAAAKAAADKAEAEKVKEEIAPKGGALNFLKFLFNIGKIIGSIITNATWENMKKEAETDWETTKIFVEKTPGWTGNFLQFLYTAGEYIYNAFAFVIYYLSYIWEILNQILVADVPKKNPNFFERYFLRLPFNIGLTIFTSIERVVYNLIIGGGSSIWELVKFFYSSPAKIWDLTENFLKFLLNTGMFISTKIERGVYNLMKGGVSFVLELLKLPFLPLFKIWDLIVYVYEGYILQSLIIITTSLLAHFIRGGKEYIVSFIFGIIYFLVGVVHMIKSTLQTTENYLSNLSDELLMESYSSVGQKVPEEVLQDYFKFTPNSTREEFRRKESKVITLYQEDLKKSVWKYPLKLVGNYALSSGYFLTSKIIKLGSVSIKTTATWFFSTLILLFIIILIKWKVR